MQAKMPKYPYSKFQFQYGTIKRPEPEASDFAGLISIPVWYD